jgi:hypothetical protein
VNDDSICTTNYAVSAPQTNDPIKRRTDIAYPLEHRPGSFSQLYSDFGSAGGSERYLLLPWQYFVFWRLNPARNIFRQPQRSTRTSRIHDPDASDTRGTLSSPATLDGRVEATSAVFESKFMLPWSFSEEAAAEKYMPQLQHNMWVVAARSAVLSVITGGGKWVEITTHADPLYQHLIVTAERKFWRCVESGEPPQLFGVEPPKPRIEAVRIVDMSSSNSWAEFAGLFRSTRQAFLDHERSKAELKALMPEDAKEAIGHAVRAKRSKSGAVSFDLLEVEGSRAAL